MPLKTQTNDWVKAARQAMRAEMHSGAAWYISESRGSVKLEVLHEGKKQSRILEYEWDKKGLFNAARRIVEIYKNFYSDTGKYSLAKSCEIVNTASSKSDINLDETIKDFRIFLPTVSNKTWEKSYKPVLNKTKELLISKKKPVDGEDLMLKALAQWEHGTRSRQIARRALQKFLEYAVIRGKLSNIYAPVKIVETLKKKRIGKDIFFRGMKGGILSIKTPIYSVSLYELLKAYATINMQKSFQRVNIPKLPVFTTAAAKGLFNEFKENSLVNALVPMNLSWKCSSSSSLMGINLTTVR